jgi:hypothetical protein
VTAAAVGSYPVASAWAASTDTSVGTIKTPGNGHYYVATGTANGTTGTVAPIWPTGGGTILDGTVTWLDKGLASYDYRGVARTTTTTVVTNTSTSAVISTTVVDGSGINSAKGPNPGAVPPVTTLAQLLSTGAPRCITCHINHGTSAVAGPGVTAETSLVTGTTLGSSLLKVDGRTMCQACHAK